MPDGPPPVVSVTDDASGIETRMFRVAVEQSGGSIGELVHRDSGRNLVRAGGTLNGLSGAVLSAVRRERMAGIGERLIARRATGQHVLQSTITAYDALPWVDIENAVAEGPPRMDADWTWDFDHAIEHATWEVAGGTQEASPPMLEARVLRWAALQGAGGTVLLGVGRSAAKPHARSAACRSNLKQIAVAMILYSVDYNGLAPDASTWQTDLQPYIRSTLLCNCPSGGRYEMNPALSRANLLQIANPSQTPLVYDAGFPNGKPPHPEGWNVAFADGHAKAISEAGASQYRSP